MSLRKLILLATALTPVGPALCAGAPQFGLRRTILAGITQRF